MLLFPGAQEVRGAPGQPGEEEPSSLRCYGCVQGQGVPTPGGGLSEPTRPCALLVTTVPSQGALQHPAITPAYTHQNEAVGQHASHHPTQTQCLACSRT